MLIGIILFGLLTFVLSFTIARRLESIEKGELATYQVAEKLFKGRFSVRYS
ncbi:MAG TPA: hypothetical protein VLH56_02260 [Dissulfurispiraceae bacterium]|nr:hypothetical protein [Dissulfurispiraceae bacterium]